MSGGLDAGLDSNPKKDKIKSELTNRLFGFVLRKICNKNQKPASCYSIINQG